VALVPDKTPAAWARGVGAARRRRGCADRRLTADADIVVKVAAPTPVELDRLKLGAALIGLLGSLRGPECTRRGITAFALEAIPRSSRAQAMDALSSQATIASRAAPR
jgi:NAD(P) transhydrogenase subunit alpha